MTDKDYKEAIRHVREALAQPLISQETMKHVREFFAQPLISQETMKQISSSLEKFASIASQIRKTIAESPVLQSLSETTQRIQENMKAIEKQYMFRKAIIERWKSLECELKSNNRYFPKSDFISIFDECTKHAGLIIGKGKVLYRTRKIEEKDINKKVGSVVSAINDRIDDSIIHEIIGSADTWEYIESIPHDDWVSEYAEPFDLHDIKFWGYEAEKSDAPTNEQAQTPGRVNPPGIAYLYTATGYKTAIAEIQPMNGQLISVAKIRIKKNLKLFSFEFHESLKNEILDKATLKDFKALTGKSYWELRVFFDTISELFSKPAFSNSGNYYATQYISEYIKSRGFDGIKFRSSLKKGGFNIVLFDTSKDESQQPKNYEITESYLHLVKNVTIASTRILPK